MASTLWGLSKTATKDTKFEYHLVLSQNNVFFIFARSQIKKFFSNIFWKLTRSFKVTEKYEFHGTEWEM